MPTLKALMMQYLIARQIPKELLDSYCVRCGYPKSYCPCETKHCPKCKSETMHNPVKKVSENTTCDSLTTEYLHRTQPAGI